MRKIILFVFVLFFSAFGTIIHAQKHKKFSGFINFNLGIPSGEYKTVNGRTGVGGRAAFLYNPSPKIPIYVGAELGYMLIGQDREFFYANVLGFTDEYRVTASNNVLTALINVRFQPMGNKPVRPFAEFLFGANDFFSTVTVERQTFFSNQALANSNSSRARWALCYGGSTGMSIRLDKKGDTWLELRCSYLAGNRTKYLTDPKIANNGDVSFTEKESKTNMFVPQVGLKFDF